MNSWEDGSDHIFMFEVDLPASNEEFPYQHSISLYDDIDLVEDSEIIMEDPNGLYYEDENDLEWNVSNPPMYCTASDSESSADSSCPQHFVHMAQQPAWQTNCSSSNDSVENWRTLLHRFAHTVQPKEQSTFQRHFFHEKRMNTLLHHIDTMSVDTFIACNSTQLWNMDIVYGRQFRDFVCQILKKPIPETHYKKRKQPVKDQKKLIRKKSSSTVMKRSQPASQIKLVTFLLDCLEEEYYANIIRWKCKDIFQFEILNSTALAHLWCVLKDNDVVCYDYLTRSIRMARKKNLFIIPAKKQNKVYQFSPNVYYDWLDTLQCRKYK